MLLPLDWRANDEPRELLSIGLGEARELWTQPPGCLARARSSAPAGSLGALAPCSRCGRHHGRRGAAPGAFCRLTRLCVTNTELSGAGTAALLRQERARVRVSRLNSFRNPGKVENAPTATLTAVAKWPLKRTTVRRESVAFCDRHLLGLRPKKICRVLARATEPVWTP